ncbi:MAG: prepilin-type N-terminal cleavage/methylation domain-containing protein [Deferribacteraceae bacterium]|nr:prepilin-type N-terminal cleavage/methylation domain-containing protein [Deferribacteraceae bacterium]
MNLNRPGLARGFTLIELAVVLVIVGVIIGMAFKGLDLIDTANTRSELQKVMKIRNALAAWISVNTKTEATGDFPKEDNTSILSMLSGKHIYKFSELDGLTDEDRKNPFDSWYLIGGSALSAGHDLDSGFGDSFFLYSKNLSKRFICNVEVLLDDDNTSTGVARSNISNDNASHEIGCYKLINDPDNTSYLSYRLF